MNPIIRGNLIVELRNNVKGELVMEIFSQETEMTDERYDEIVDREIRYLLAEGFIDTKPQETAIYSRFGVIVKHH